MKAAFLPVVSRMCNVYLKMVRWTWNFGSLPKVKIWETLFSKKKIPKQSHKVDKSYIRSAQWYCSQNNSNFQKSKKYSELLMFNSQTRKGPELVADAGMKCVVMEQMEQWTEVIVVITIIFFFCCCYRDSPPSPTSLSSQPSPASFSCIQILVFLSKSGWKSNLQVIGVFTYWSTVL